jgi:hypothetical protein
MRFFKKKLQAVSAKLAYSVAFLSIIPICVQYKHIQCCCQEQIFLFHARVCQPIHYMQKEEYIVSAMQKEKLVACCFSE